jgi:hypothetical protein
MKTEKIAKTAHELNKLYCESMGDMSQPSWEDAPDWQKESAVSGVEQIRENPNTSQSESHEGWLRQKLDSGWKYGPIKDPDKKEHSCCVPYDELPEFQKSKDAIFGAVVRGLLSVE